MPAPVLAASDLALRLRAGEAAIIPTDTLPGLAVRPDQAQTLWRLKCRPADKPLILMGASVNDLLHEVEGPCHREVEALAERCLLYTSPSPRDKRQSRMPSSA